MNKILILALAGTFALSCPATTKKCNEHGKCGSGATVKHKKSDCKMKMKSEKKSSMKMEMKDGMKCQAGKCSGGK